MRDVQPRLKDNGSRLPSAAVSAAPPTYSSTPNSETSVVDLTALSIVFIIPKLNVQRRHAPVRLELGKLKELTNRWLRQARRWFHILVGVAFFIFAMVGATLSFSEWR